MCCISGSEIPVSELADSIFADQISKSCVGGSEVLVHSRNEVVNLFILNLSEKLLLFKSFLNLASYCFFLILVVLQRLFLLCGLILFINILVVHSNWQLYFEHHVAHLDFNVIDGTPGYIRSMTCITSQIRVSFSVVTYLVSCVLSSQFSYSYSHSNFWSYLKVLYRL